MVCAAIIVVDVCEYKVRMIYHPAVPLGDGGFVISIFYFFRQEEFIIKSLGIGFFGIGLVGKMRSYQTKSGILLRVLFLQLSDIFGTHLVKPAHSSVKEHCPAFGFFELFQFLFDLFPYIRLKNLPLSRIAQVTILFYSHFPSQNKKVSVYKLRESLNTFIILLALCEGQ